MIATLAKYDAACRAIAAAKDVDEVKQIRNMAEALRAYARQAKNRTLEVDAAEIRIRAERRVGELIAAQRDTVGLRAGGWPKSTGADLESCGSKSDPQDSALPSLAEAGIDKHLADRARKLAAVPSSEFEALVGDWRGRVQQETERVTTNLIRAGEREQAQRERTPAPLPVGEFRLIYADPPWRYEHVETDSRAIENHYPTMSLDEICALAVPAADDCVLFLWATSPKLAEAMRVIESWGFTYRTCAVWDKEQIGMGYYFRQQHELLLVAARGALPVPEPSDRVSSVIRVRRSTVHSRKPVEVVEIIERMYPTMHALDRLELFTRQPRVGWSSWGNEPTVNGA